MDSIVVRNLVVPNRVDRNYRGLDGNCKEIDLIRGS